MGCWTPPFGNPQVLAGAVNLAELLAASRLELRCRWGKRERVRARHGRRTSTASVLGAAPPGPLPFPLGDVCPSCVFAPTFPKGESLPIMRVCAWYRVRNGFCGNASANLAEAPAAKRLGVPSLPSRELRPKAAPARPQRGNPKGKTFSLKDQNCISSLPAVPDSLTLSEVLDLFKTQRSDFAVVLNEYALTVGVITLNDIMSTVMGEFVLTPDEAQIVQRSDGSWLIDGATPIDDVERVFDFGQLPEDETYETVAGFMMYMLRKIPKLTDHIEYGGYRFEVIDVERHRIDQILVTKIGSKDEDKKPLLPEQSSEQETAAESSADGQPK